MLRATAADQTRPTIVDTYVTGPKGVSEVRQQEDSDQEGRHRRRSSPVSGRVCVPSGKSACQLIKTSIAEQLVVVTSCVVCADLTVRPLFASTCTVRYCTTCYVYVYASAYAVRDRAVTRTWSMDTPAGLAFQSVRDDLE